MVELEKLMKRLRSAEKKEDYDKLDSTRLKIIEQHGDSPEAAEARYKLGLSKLLRLKKPEEAEALFRDAASSGDPLFSPMARISLALMLHAQKKEQKSLFELRKVVGSRKPSAQSVIALAFIVTVLKDMGAKPNEVKRAREQQIEHLRAVIDETAEPIEQAALLLQLGLALFDQRDASGAREVLEQVIGFGPVLSEDIRDAATATLAALK